MVRERSWTEWAFVVAQWIKPVKTKVHFQMQPQRCLFKEWHTHPHNKVHDSISSAKMCCYIVSIFRTDLALSKQPFCSKTFGTVSTINPLMNSLITHNQNIPRWEHKITSSRVSTDFHPDKEPFFVDELTAMLLRFSPQILQNMTMQPWCFTLKVISFLKWTCNIWLPYSLLLISRHHIEKNKYK